MSRQRSIADLLAEHGFFAGLEPGQLEFLGGCGRNVRFAPGELLLREGDEADYFYLIRDGRVAVEVAAAERGPLVVDTLEVGDVAGASWLTPPYRWIFDVRAVGPVGAIRFDGRCIRDKCHENPRLGYALMQRFAGIFRDRMQSARTRLLDLYGPVEAGQDQAGVL